MLRVDVKVDDELYAVELEMPGGDETELVAWVNGEPVRVVLPPANHPSASSRCFVIADRPYEFDADPALRWIRAGGGMHRVQLRSSGRLQSRGQGRAQRDERLRSLVGASPVR